MAARRVPSGGCTKPASHVLADKPWLVEPNDLEDVRRSLDARPLVVEMMTGRHDVTARLMKRVVDAPDVFGSFFTGGPAIELESVHHLEKLVDGAPLRRPGGSSTCGSRGRAQSTSPRTSSIRPNGLSTGPETRPRGPSALVGARLVHARAVGRVPPYHRRGERSPLRSPRSWTAMRSAISAMSR